SKIFSNDMITFAHADILSQDFDQPIADVIILASVIQYFPKLENLFNKIKGLLKPFGEIHILDSPVYSERTVRSAKERSMNYFSRANQERMNSYYHHHTWDSLSGSDYDVLYDPESGWEKLKQVFIKDSPFPWLKLMA
ncbi:MAG TPA: class I SAM-dependent methyltransferase, partial [Cyclobacteriaceae bacterium]|nr:class I SAM-dependent methyltransferase [Cyclobacteriaceae bacterium]